MSFPEGFWRSHDAHKGSGGRLSVIAGSVGYAGAGLLTSCAAVVAGCGYVRWWVPETLYTAVAASFVDGVVTPLADAGAGHFCAHHAPTLLKEPADAWVVGPGWGQCAQRRGLLWSLLKESKGPLLVDADALNLMVDHDDRWPKNREHLVITPHPGEAARLLQTTPDEINADRDEAVWRLHQLTGAVVVLKGPGTVILDSAETDPWVNTTDSPILATAGSGDVLAGLIGALMARGISAGESSRTAVSWHGRAGQLLETRHGPQGVGASALIDTLLEIQDNERHEASAS